MMVSPPANHRYRMSSPSIGAAMREVLRKLCDIDFQHQVDLYNLEQSDTGDDRKVCIKGGLRAAHSAKRQPYADLLNDLRIQQHRPYLAA
jgi:hypothetical protein